MSYSIGINIVPERCLDDLNALLKTIAPIAREMPWSHWLTIMQNGNKLITCFDDDKSQIIGMTTVIPIIKPTGNFVEICDTAVLKEYRDLQITARLLVEADALIQKMNLVLL